ncbi:MAG: glycosyltransferase [Bacteroidales bacterium]|nr:glycosyltransferase [Bacteroidales bacterium]
MKISILIPTKNRLPILRETLHNIYYVNNLPKEDFEVIVSNDGDDDLSVLYDEFPFDNLKIVKNTHKPGAAGNRNNAADYAQYDLLQFLDDDILITENFLERVVDIRKSYTNVIISHKEFFSQEYINKANETPFGIYRLNFINRIKPRETIKEFDEDGLYEVNFTIAGAFSVEKNVFYKVGKFDENFQYAGWEDAEFAFRAFNNGVRLLYDVKNPFFHNETDRLIIDNWLKRQEEDFKTLVQICKKYPIFQTYSSWVTNTPLKKSDPPKVKILKLKKIFCSFPLVYNFIHFLAIYGEKIKLPDSFLFRLYNALWLGATYRGFRKAYKEIFVNSKS